MDAGKFRKALLGEVGLEAGRLHILADLPKHLTICHPVLETTFSRGLTSNMFDVRYATKRHPCCGVLQETNIERNPFSMINRQKVFNSVSSAVLAALLLTGCTSTGTQNFDEDKVAQIKKGVTTEQDLVSIFGPPQNRSVDSSGQVTMTWVYAEYHMNAVSFIPIAGGLMTGGKGTSKALSVTLADGKVKDFTFSNGGNAVAAAKTAPQPINSVTNSAAAQ